MLSASKSSKEMASALFVPCLGFLNSHTFLIRSPKLNAAHLSVWALSTFSSPRSQVRLPSPVSQTWAKVRSHRLLRQRLSWRPRFPHALRRLARNASSYSAGLSVQHQFFCFLSGMYVRISSRSHHAKSPLSW